MSGHSKWANIKHKKAKGDAAKAKIFTKIGREIAVAVKSGGSDPSTNSKLFDIIAKARANNMPNDRIQNGIKKASGELSSVNYEETLYEGYGVGGIAVLVECLTDNKNRTSGDVRYCFDKSGGQMGTSGCVSFMFDRRGVIVIDKTSAYDFDSMMEIAIEAGADDIKDEEDVYEIITDIANFSAVRNYLSDKGIALLSAEIEWIPQNSVSLPEDKIDHFNRMLERLDELDDVSNVYHNCDNNDIEDEEE